MSDDSTDFTVNNEEEERRARSGRSGGMAKRLKTLLCCLKREPRAEETVIGYNPDECDYVVEKLVVKRVPLALFAIPADLADNASRSTSSSAENVARETSARVGKRTATNEALRFGDERRDSAGRQVHSRNKFVRSKGIYEYYFFAWQSNLRKHNPILQN